MHVFWLFVHHYEDVLKHILFKRYFAYFISIYHLVSLWHIDCTTLPQWAYTALISASPTIIWFSPHTGESPTPQPYLWYYTVANNGLISNQLPFNHQILLALLPSILFQRKAGISSSTPPSISGSLSGCSMASTFSSHSLKVSGGMGGPPPVLWAALWLIWARALTRALSSVYTQHPAPPPSCVFYIYFALSFRMDPSCSTPTNSNTNPCGCLCSVRKEVRRSILVRGHSVRLSAGTAISRWAPKC